MSLRTLLIVLLLLNLVAFAGGRMGWLGHSDLRGEPERLTNQIRPDAIEPGARPPAAAAQASSTRKSIPPAADVTVAQTPAPIAPPDQSCTAYSVRGRAALAEVTTLAEPHKDIVTLSQQTLEEPANWRVRIPPTATVEAGEQRVATLQQRGVSDMYLIRGEGPNRWAVSLGLFSTEAAAEQRLESLRAQDVNSAEIVPGTIGHYRIELRGPKAALDTLATSLSTILGPDASGACSP